MPRIVKKADVRRSEILQAARQLFQTKDYEQTTMQDVMSHLGIAKGTIYHYFLSKQELLEAVVEDIIDEQVRQMQSVLESIQGSALEKLGALITRNNATDQNQPILEQLHRPGNAGMHARLLAVAIARQAPIYAGIIREGCEQGVFHCQHPLEAAEFLLSAIQFLTDTGIYLWEAQDISRRLAALPSLIESVLGLPPGSYTLPGPALH